MDLSTSWSNIVAWCHHHAPNTAAAIRPPAGSATLHRAEAATFGPWPADLRAWYTLMDGTERTPHGYLLPGYRPLPLDQITEHWSMWQRIAAEVEAHTTARRNDPETDYLFRLTGGPPPDGIDWHQGQPAGTPAGTFLPAYIPIAEDQSGNDMYLDLRHGPRHGCIGEFVKGDADAWGPQWTSIEAMLSDIAAALQHNRPIHRRRPIVEHDALHWRLQ